MQYFFLLAVSIFVGLGITYFYYQKNDRPPLAQMSSSSPKTDSNPFLVEKPPKDSLVGTILTLDGDVKWQSRTATTPAVLAENISLYQQETVETGEDGIFAALFGNAIEVDLSSNSIVDLTQTLPTNFVINQRKGTVKYVQKNASIPLTVRSYPLIVKITGTTTIKIDDEEEDIILHIESGSITLAYNDFDVVSNVVTAKEGDTVAFDKTTREVSIE